MTVHAPVPTAVVAITGADVRTFLDATLSQKVGDLAAGHWRAALWLDVHGAPLATLDLVVPPGDADRLLALVPAELTTTVVDGLGGRTFLADVTLALREDLAVVAVRAAPSTGLPDEFAAVAEGQVTELGDRTAVGRRNGVDLIVAAADLDRVSRELADAGIAPVGVEAVRALDVEAGVPAWGTEVVAPNLPEEYGLLPTHVHLDKGCYPGQEAVARMWMLGRPRRRLARLRVDGDVEAGAEVGEGRQRVRVTSVAGHHALGYVPPDAEVGDRFAGDGWGAEVVGLVGADREVVGHQPDVRRRRDRT